MEARVRFMELGKVTIAAGEVSEPETVLVNAEHILKVRSGPQHYNTSNVTLLDGKSLDVNEPFEQLKARLEHLEITEQGIVRDDLRALEGLSDDALL
jgi:hypothetical protein